MKKLSLAVCCMFMLSSLAIAQPGAKPGYGPKHDAMMYGYKDKETKEEREARKAKMEAFKKEHEEFQKNLDGLVEKYNKANDKGKADAKKEIRTLVAAQTDKDIAAKKDMLADQKTRIAKQEANMADFEANKDKRIDERVDFVISPEGQAKMKEKMEKKKNEKNKDKKNLKDKEKDSKKSK